MTPGQNDFARVSAGLTLVARGPADAPARVGQQVYISDDEGDPSSWQDAEDEGLVAIGRKG
jgi:hypothetical protein